MREYSREMNQRALEAKEAAARDAQAAGGPMPPGGPPQGNGSGNFISDPSGPNDGSPGGRRGDPAALDDEEGKRNLISNEIQMFRDRFKDEDTKMRNTEKERKDRYERERAMLREKRVVDETPTSGNNHSNLSPSSRDASPPPTSRDRASPRRDRGSTSRRDRTSPSDDRYRGSSSRNNNSNSVRSRATDRRGSPPTRYDRRSPPPPSSRPYNRRSRTKSPIGKAHPQEEDDEETYERKKQERRLREKELRYREVSSSSFRASRVRSFDVCSV